MPISPSNLQRRAMCPGSEREEPLAPPAPPTEHSERGTELHRLVAVMLGGGLVPARDAISDEDFEAAQFCVETVKEHVQDFQGRPGAIVLIEHQLDMMGFGLNVEEDPERCRLDFALVVPGDIAFLFDWKFGVMPGIHPRHDWQFKAYALGLAENYGVNTVQVARVQPALEEEMRVRVAEFTSDDLASFGEGIKAIVQDALSTDAALSIGPHCQFCRAKEALTCPAMQRNASVIVPRGLNLPAYLDSLEPALRKDVFERILGAKKFFEAMKEQAEGYVLAGGSVPGYTIGEGRKNRKWVDDQVAENTVATLLQNAGKPRELSVARKVVSPSQAEKLLGKSAAVREALGTVIQIEPGEPKVVKEGEE